MSIGRWESWSRMGVEAVVFVISIVFALALDEWRTGLSDRALETEYLERLRADLQANLGLVDRQHDYQRRELAAAAIAYPVVSRGEWGGFDTATVVRASYLATPSATPVWVRDTFEELKSTGRMSLIRDASLRAEILAYHGYLETADYTYDLMSTEFRDAVRERMEPDLQLRIRTDCRPRDPSCQVPVAGPELGAYVDWLVGNEELARGLRRVIVQWTRGEEEYLPGVVERTQHLIGIIERTLDGG